MITETMSSWRGTRSRETRTLPVRQDVQRLSEVEVFEDNSRSNYLTMVTIQLEARGQEVIQASSVNYTFLNAKDWLEFQQLKKQWLNERNPITSSVDVLTRSKSYQGIVELGEKAVPFILNELRSESEEPDHWFPALAAITGKNPVPPESRGRIQEMAAAWLRWGEGQV
jgi:hypothetical protein